jgi:serine/threonine protein phosphatase 1
MMPELTPYLNHDDREPGPLLSEGKRIYAIGDIHGRHDCLQAMFDLIDRDREANPASVIHEVYLGDYVDRGPNSREVIEALIKRQLSHQALCLMGNHDDMFNSSLHFGISERWFLQGGLQTIASYGLAIPNLDKRPDAAHESLIANVPASHRSFLRKLPDHHKVDDLLFVHAGVDPFEPVFAQDSKNYLWIREPFLSSGKWRGLFIVHGHTPAPEPAVRNNRIGVDTMAFMTGKLTAVVLEPDGFRFLQTQCEPDLSFGRFKHKPTQSEGSRASAARLHLPDGVSLPKRDKTTDSSKDDLPYINEDGVMVW